MKIYIIPFLIGLSLASCRYTSKIGPETEPSPLCCAPPNDFFIKIKFVSNDKKDLLFISKNESYRYDTRKIEVYKLIPDTPHPVKELLVDKHREIKTEKEVGEDYLRIKLPTDDKRVSQLLIYLYPSSDIDTITYKGGGKYNLPFPKDVFYNNISIEKLKTDGGYNGDANVVASADVYITVTKPDK